MAKIVIGVLALQGDFAEHIATLAKCGEGVECREVRKTSELVGCHALVIPGGESTVMVKLMQEFQMFDDLRAFGTKGFPIFGTCAGCIMLAKDIESMGDQPTLGLCDISVCRNAYGSQVHSFESQLKGDGSIFGGSPVNAVLIRAPMIKRAGPGTETLLTHNATPVLLREGNILACTFHPEITGDQRVHQYFCEMVRKHGKAYT
eukprot:CAMPEP_0173434618 /NCGR_PEP_ID=MMETSP1357-20121228/13148_1 /TAXON_ID=77926 /ORGANISM="Hemiselmis rufescens, Strain PCC563" /LENGTH=203 /DNA_ID=CAMNT_0014399499 /DNA_START=11 /DNA_END=622 /DNA_ORIENTATION=+